MLSGALQTLRRSKPHVLVSCHSARLIEECEQLLVGAGYTVTPLPGFEHELIATAR